MQKIKLVVTDLDETLIRPTARAVSPENLRAVRRAQAAGVPVTIATGRIYTIVKKWVEALEVDAPVIACNGADIRENHCSIYTDTLDMETARNVIETASAHDGVERFIFSGDRIYCTPEDRNEMLFEKWWTGMEGRLPADMHDAFADIYPLVEGNIQKVLLWAKNDGQHAALERDLRQYGDACDVTCGEKLNLEVNRKGVSKAVAIRYIAEKMGISTDEIMAIGDSGNDVEMLRAVGTAVVVENAMPAAKAAADYVTASCDENGVAKAIEDFVLM